MFFIIVLSIAVVMALFVWIMMDSHIKNIGIEGDKRLPRIAFVYKTGVIVLILSIILIYLIF